MIRTAAYAYLKDGAPQGAVEEIISAVRHAENELDIIVADASPTCPATPRCGDVQLLGAYRDLEQYETARHHPYVATVIEPLLEKYAELVDGVRYTQGPIILREPDIANGVQRTLLLRADCTDPEKVASFEVDLAAMTLYIDAIRNSSLSRVDESSNASKPWTHVWEQEFKDVEGLAIDYTEHSYHWSFVDQWFDPQSPLHIVDTTLIHGAGEFRRSILGLQGE